MNHANPHQSIRGDARDRGFLNCLVAPAAGLRTASSHQLPVDSLQPLNEISVLFILVSKPASNGVTLDSPIDILFPSKPNLGSDRQ